MNIINIVKSLILPSKKKISLDTPGFVETLEMVRDLYPGELLEDIEDWTDLYVYLRGIKGVVLVREDGWFKERFVLGKKGWELSTVEDETLIGDD